MNKEQYDKIERLYRANYDKLYYYANSLLQNPGLAQEAVQETFCVACIKAEELLDSGRPEQWLFATLRNLARNTNRRRQRANRYLLRAIAEFRAEDFAQGQDAEFPLFCAEVLKPEDFELVRRIVLDGRSHLEAAEELGISLNACRKRYYRALKKLRTAYEKNNCPTFGLVRT